MAEMILFDTKVNLVDNPKGQRLPLSFSQPEFAETKFVLVLTKQRYLCLIANWIHSHNVDVVVAFNILYFDG